MTSGKGFTVGVCLRPAQDSEFRLYLRQHTGSRVKPAVLYGWNRISRTVYFLLHRLLLIWCRCIFQAPLKPQASFCLLT